MNYKTILVHVDGAAGAATRIALAAQLALSWNAHLIGAAFTGLSRFVYQDGSVDLARTVLAPYMDGLYHKIGRELDEFSRLAALASVPSCESRLVDDEPGAGLVLASRYVDIVVLGQHEPGTPAVAAGDLLAYVLLASARPLLVVPYVQTSPLTGRRVLVGWDGSIQAARALTAALPFLHCAECVTVARFGVPDPPDDEAGHLSSFLDRHGVAASFVDRPAQSDVGSALLTLAVDLKADLLVMGGYGHARLRELVLGGATRTIMEAMTIPVLLVH